MNPMKNEEDMEMAEDTKEYEGTPLDGIIQRVQSYIDDPKKITPETLTELKEELEGLKDYMDGGEDEGSEVEATDEEKPGGEGKSPGLTIMIGKVAKSGMKALLLMSLLSFTKTLYAAQMNPVRLPAVNQHVSETVYTSTGISAYGSLLVSTYPYALHTLVICSTGSSDSTVELWDTKVATNAVGAILRMPAISTFDPSFGGIFDLFFSSGMVINSSGTIPAKVGIIGRVK